MKKILITGENSYIGTSFQKWLAQYPEEYQVDTISVRGDEWQEKDFSEYDVVYHVAGIAHIKETKKNQDLYYKVNRDLAYEVAKKSKNDGIKQFIFLSSMSVYGIEEGIITKNTPLKPKTAYGKSKMEAESLLQNLENEYFEVAIIRPPMVYGKDSKGNYSKLAKLAKITPIVPNIKNQRSMIFIDNLSELSKLIIDSKDKGIFCPQNEEYVSTSDMINQIADANGHDRKLIKFLGSIIKIIKLPIIVKIFGNLVYDQEFSKYREDYAIVDFNQSIILSERFEMDE